VVRAVTWATVVVLYGLAGTAQQPQDITLRVGESRPIGSDLTVRFEAVLSDSRCPAGVQCVSAGDAVVRIQATTRGAAAQVYELHTDDEPRSASHGGRAIALTKLAPPPKSNATTQASQYRLTLRVR